MLVRSKSSAPQHARFPVSHAPPATVSESGRSDYSVRRRASPLNAESPPGGGLSAIRRSGGVLREGDVHKKVSPSVCLRCLTQHRIASRSAFVGCSAVGDHLLVQHAAVRACPGYDRHEAPSMLMAGNSMALDTEHGRAVEAQLARRQESLEEAIEAANF